MNLDDPSHKGMLMPEQLAAQEPFDRAFVDSMVLHHASA
jgi:uncharacterized protein (DUF305 family)